MRLVVTHLTRMRAPYICVAGINLATGAHVRLVLESGQLDRSMMAQSGGPFHIASVVDLGPTWYAGQVPETEDHRFNRRKAVPMRSMSPDDFWRLLEHTAHSRLVDIFGPDLHRRGEGYAVDVGEGQASLGALRLPQAPVLAVTAFGKIRLRLAGGHASGWLSVTDVRLYEHDHVTANQDRVRHLARRIEQGARVIVTVGLSRAWLKPGDTVSRHWLQVNNIYLDDDPLWGGDQRHNVANTTAVRSTPASRCGETVPRTAEPIPSPTPQVRGTAPRDVPVSSDVDHALRTAVMAYWRALPDGERSLDRIEHDLARRLRAVLRSMGPDLPLFRPSASDRCAEGSDGHDCLAALRRDYPKAYTPWTPRDDALLNDAWEDGATVEYMARLLQRQPGAIRSRLGKLGLRD